MTWALAFVGMAAVDWLYAEWTRHIVARDPMRAGGTAAGLYAVNAAVTLAIVGDPWLVLPASAGAFLGTWASVQRA